MHLFEPRTGIPAEIGKSPVVAPDVTDRKVVGIAGARVRNEIGDAWQFRLASGALPVPHQADMPDRPDDADMSSLEMHRADQSERRKRQGYEGRVQSG